MCTLNKEKRAPCKIPKFNLSVGILWKHTVSSKFRAIRLKLCRTCAFSQISHTRKLREITVFFALTGNEGFHYRYL